MEQQDQQQVTAKLEVPQTTATPAETSASE
jgi:hypothetical protein